MEERQTTEKKRYSPFEHLGLTKLKAMSLRFVSYIVKSIGILFLTFAIKNSQVVH